MGATDFQVKQRGKSLIDAYKKAVMEAIEESGNDQYNGTISTTTNVIDKTEAFKTSKLTIQEFIDKHIEYCRKRGPAWGVCLEDPTPNKLKVKSKVINVPSKGTKKWELKYVVVGKGDELKSCDTKGEAVSYGRQWVEKNGGTVYIDTQKVLVNGSPRVAEIKYLSSGEKEGVYIFFGMAAC